MRKNFKKNLLYKERNYREKCTKNICKCTKCTKKCTKIFENCKKWSLKKRNAKIRQNFYH